MEFTTEQLTDRFEDQREIKNLMGKYVVSCLLKQEIQAFESFWSGRDDICLGFNNGYYRGKEAVEGYYRALDRLTDQKAEILQVLFPDKIGKKTKEEIHGIGLFEIKPLVNAIVEIATDEETAKGIWCCQGSYTDLYECGPLAFWTWGYFCADFVRDDEEWKIWHLLYLEDINHPCGENWTEPARQREPLPEFAAIKNLVPPAPNVPMELRELYRPDRPFTRTPDFPVPYDTFSETFSYGI